MQESNPFSYIHPRNYQLVGEQHQEEDCKLSHENIDFGWVVSEMSAAEI